MEYSIQYVRDHVEVFDADGNFVFSADTFQEAQADLELLA